MGEFSLGKDIKTIDGFKKKGGKFSLHFISGAALTFSCQNLSRIFPGEWKIICFCLLSRFWRYVPARGLTYPCTTYPRRALRTREGRYRYPRRALRTREGRDVPTKGTREGRYVPAKGVTYPRRTLRPREVPAKGATYPRRALRTHEGRYVPAKGARYPRRALCTREGRYTHPRLRALRTREGR